MRNRSREGRGRMARFELEQDGMVVAAVEGPRESALSDIVHYGLMYGQDGSCTTFEVVGRKRIKMGTIAVSISRPADTGDGT